MTTTNQHSQDNSHQVSPEKIQELKALLEKETQTYQDMAKTMMDKKTLLIKGQYKQLGTVDQELASLGNQSVQIEARRMELMSDMGQEDKTLEELIKVMPPQQAQHFIPLRKRLIHVVRDVQDINKQNSRLLELSIKWIEDTVETIAKAVTPQAATYDAKGLQTRKKGSINAMPTQSTIVKDI